MHSVCQHILTKPGVGPSSGSFRSRLSVQLPHCVSGGTTEQQVMEMGTFETGVSENVGDS